MNTQEQLGTQDIHTSSPLALSLFKIIKDARDVLEQSNREFINNHGGVFARKPPPIEDRVGFLEWKVSMTTGVIAQLCHAIMEDEVRKTEQSAKEST